MNANELAIETANRMRTVEALDGFLDSLYRDPEITPATQTLVYRLYLARRSEQAS